MKPEKYLLPLLPGADHRKKGWHTGKDKGILSAEIDYLVQVRHAGTGSGKDLVSSSPFYFFPAIASRRCLTSKNIRHGGVDIDLMVQEQQVYNGRTTP
jgi:hypothetical protein